MISNLSQYLSELIDSVYSLLDKISLLVSVTIFTAGSTLDVVTTWYGYSNGLSEFSPLVRFFLIELGPLNGVILSKIVSLVIIIGLTAVNALYYLVIKDTDHREISMNMLRDLFVIAGVVYIGAGINNTLVIHLYLL